MCVWLPIVKHIFHLIFMCKHVCVCVCVCVYERVCVGAHFDHHSIYATVMLQQNSVVFFLHIDINVFNANMLLYYYPLQFSICRWVIVPMCERQLFGCMEFSIESEFPLICFAHFEGIFFLAANNNRQYTDTQDWRTISFVSPTEHMHNQYIKRSSHLKSKAADADAFGCWYLKISILAYIMHCRCI